jgi:hypothetical protein
LTGSSESNSLSYFNFSAGWIAQPELEPGGAGLAGPPVNTFGSSPYTIAKMFRIDSTKFKWDITIFGGAVSLDMLAKLRAFPA